MKSLVNYCAGGSRLNALRKQHGLTLVELMIAMTIGLLLLGGITSIMISSRQTYRVNEALSRMQDNARYAFQVLSRDIRMAGYFGCVGSDVTPTNTLSGPTDFLWNFKQTIYGYEATSDTAWNLTPDSSITSLWAAGTLLSCAAHPGMEPARPPRYWITLAGRPPGRPI